MLFKVFLFRSNEKINSGPRQEAVTLSSFPTESPLRDSAVSSTNFELQEDYSEAEFVFLTRSCTRRVPEAGDSAKK
jgi:hypothetical protein